MSNPETAAPADAPEGGKKGASKLVLILALVGGLAAGGAGGAFALGPMVAKKVAPSAAADSAHAEEEPEEEEAKEGEGAAAAKPVHTIDNLVLNPAESGGQRFLLLTIAFELKDAAALEELKARDAELRDAVLQSVGAKSVDYLSDMTKRDSIRAELKTVAGKFFPDAKKPVVRRIYFPQFVIQ
ncbi:flagellar basal body-associated FliL family protein [Roseisolibacter sp. H3M3-2]|uniref:flagellar basal body-associated FliL family protein n=1 Tax=Roseisolibacter sp. H3M3-2 TaxID=3031323 RepID=UPI0023D99815|nr:flagellar basal body-associated FliL family protein [Roseisolibacter sp. H3M3-2]MDF1505255.1 flagellar basal body-associated FliL family protein [Roseisolibacter sp. H3M3-2]